MHPDQPRRRWTQTHRGRRPPRRQPKPYGTPCNHHHATEAKAQACAVKLTVATRQGWRAQIVTRRTRPYTAAWEAVCCTLNPKG